MYADKEGTGTGALYRDMTWAQLNTKKAELAPSGQYLADIENGTWRMVGVFRKRSIRAQGIGALQTGLSWSTIFARQGEYAKLGAYLADVETYVDGGTRRYLGVWRVGPGAGAMINTGDPQAFVKILEDRRTSQGLIDIERYVDGGRVFQIGVHRHAAAGRSYVREAWDALVGHWQAFAPTRTLIDIEEDSNVAMEY